MNTLDNVAQSAARERWATVKARTARAVHIAPEGLVISVSLLLVGAALTLSGLYWLGVPVLLISAAIGSFFRDPERVAPAAARDAVISAADGRVCDISQAPIPGGDDARYHRVAVFMSPLNVHVNRSPTTGQVVRVEHTPGDFSAAFRDTASEHNERTVVEFADRTGRRHAIVQIAGYLARRIVCRVCVSDAVEQGQRIGLIMFGSRVDHFLPLDYRVSVKLGDRVRAGQSVLGELSDGN